MQKRKPAEPSLKRKMLQRKRPDYLEDLLKPPA